MTLQPWIARELAAQRAADLEHEAALCAAVGTTGAKCAPGPLALRAGRALVALGWRLGGPAALPTPVQRRLV